MLGVGLLRLGEDRGRFLAAKGLLPLDLSVDLVRGGAGLGLFLLGLVQPRLTRVEKTDDGRVVYRKRLSRKYSRKKLTMVQISSETLMLNISQTSSERVPA